MLALPLRPPMPHGVIRSHSRLVHWNLKQPWPGIANPVPHPRLHLSDPLLQLVQSILDLSSGKARGPRVVSHVLGRNEPPVFHAGDRQLHLDHAVLQRLQARGFLGHRLGLLKSIQGCLHRGVLVGDVRGALGATTAAGQQTGDQLNRQHHPSNAPSVMSRPASMMAKPSRSCSSVMQRGGLHMKWLHRTKVNMPWARKKAPSSFMAGWVPL